MTDHGYALELEWKWYDANGQQNICIRPTNDQSRAPVVYLTTQQTLILTNVLKNVGRNRSIAWNDVQQAILQGFYWAADEHKVSQKRLHGLTR